jgi:hypothetical protein
MSTKSSKTWPAPWRELPLASSYGQRRSEASEVEHLERLAVWLDSAFRIPGLGLQFGFDAILDLIPGLGDVLGAIASFYIFGAARRLGVPRITLVRMAINIAIDYVGGLLPILGTVFDAYWKANIWNVALLRRALSATTVEARKARRADWLFVVAILVVLVAIMVGMTAAMLWLIALVGRMLFSGA